MSIVLMKVSAASVFCVGFVAVCRLLMKSSLAFFFIDFHEFRRLKFYFKLYGLNTWNRHEVLSEVKVTNFVNNRSMIIGREKIIFINVGRVRWVSKFRTHAIANEGISKICGRPLLTKSQLCYLHWTQFRCLKFGSRDQKSARKKALDIRLTI